MTIEQLIAWYVARAAESRASECVTLEAATSQAPHAGREAVSAKG